MEMQQADTNAEYWFSLPANEALAKILEGNERRREVIGKYVPTRAGAIGWLDDIRSLEFSPLTNPAVVAGSPARLQATATNTHGLIPGAYYRFSLDIEPVAHRRRHNRPFGLITRGPFEPYEFNPKDFVTRIAAEFSADSKLSRLASRSVDIITGEINHLPQTFVYELLQNADDYPRMGRKVHVTFELTERHLLVMHDGAVFSPANVDAICDIGAGDKTGDINQIGFKGIGFKAVFSHSNHVTLRSGAFSFSFINPLTTRVSLWQVKPIWMEEDILREDLPDIFFNNPVSIALKPNKPELLGDGPESFYSVLSKVFADARILLFLRNVDEVHLRRGGRFIRTVRKEGESWIVSDPFVVAISSELQEWVAKELSGSDKKVPEKYRGITQTGISFATRMSKNTVGITTDAMLYVFLPTDINLNFPFLINGDFIPDGSRTGLHELKWNTYLMEQAGKQFIHWMAFLGTKEYQPDYLKLLPDFPACKASIDANHHKYVDAFEQGVLSEKDAIAFIPDTTGALRKAAELLVDTTGFSQLYGEAALREIAGAADRAILHSSLLHYLPLLKLLAADEAAIVFGWSELRVAVEQNETLKGWLQVPANNADFLHWLTEAHKPALSHWPVYLSNGGNLLVASALFRTLGDDAELLVWATYPYLHPEVEALTRSLSLPAVDLYTPEAYIVRHLLSEGNLQAHRTGFAEKEANYGFWRYISHHVGTLTDTQKARLLGFGFYDFKGNYIAAFEGRKVYQEHASLVALLESGALPEVHIVLFAQDYVQSEDKLPGWQRLWAKLGVYGFEPVAFLKEEIAARASGILKSASEEYAQNVLNDQHDKSLRASRSLWHYVHEAIQFVPTPEQPAAYKALDELPVLAGRHPTGVFALNRCYLGDEYNDETLEQLLSQFTPETSYAFTIRGYAGDEIDAHAIGNLWKQCGITYKAEGLILAILERLSELKEENRQAAFSLFYKHRNNYSKFSALETFSLLLTAEGAWVEPSKVILGDKYTATSWLESLLPNVKIPHQLDDSYAADNGAGHELLQFLKDIGCKAVETEAMALELKVDALLARKWEAEERELSVGILKEIDMLHRANKLSDDLLKKLANLPLLIQGAGVTFAIAATCYLPSVYEPKLDVETILPSEVASGAIAVLSKVYDGAGINKKLLRALGVMEDIIYKIDKERQRPQLPVEYVAEAETKLPIIRAKMVAYPKYIPDAKPWVEIPLHRFISNPRIAKRFWERAIESEDFRRAITQQVSYGIFPEHRLQMNCYPIWLAQRTPSILTDGGTTCKKPSKLYSLKFQGIVPEEQLPFIDLRPVSIGNKTLEAWIGIRQELDLVAILSYITTQPSLKKLKEAEIWQSLQQKLTANKLTAEEQAALDDFKRAGLLPSQMGSWQPLSELMFKSKDFKLHLAKSEKLVHDDALAVASALGIPELTVEKLNPIMEGDADDDFAAHLKARLIYISFFLHPEDYEATTESLQALIAPLTFVAGKRIVMEYAGISTYDEACVRRDDTVYYLLRRKGYRDDGLYEPLHDKVFGFKKQGSISLKYFKDFLINDEEDVRLICKGEHPEYFPLIWEATAQPLIEDNEIKVAGTVVNEPMSTYQPIAPTPTEADSQTLSDADIAELRRLMRKPELTEDAMFNYNLESQQKGLLYLGQEGYDTADADESFHENHVNHMLSPVTHPEHPGEAFTVMCRSAKGKLLYISYAAWENLAKPDYKLFVWTGSLQTSILIHSQKELSGLSKDAWVMKLDEADKQTSLTNLFTGKAPLSTNLYMYIRLPGTSDNSALFAAIEKSIEARAGEELGGNTLDEDAV